MNTENIPSPEELLEIYCNYKDAVRKQPFGVIKRGTKMHEIAPEEPEMSAYDELQSMVGLDEIKVFVDKELSYHRIMKLRKNMGAKVPDRRLHLLLTGGPGTGKTTCASIIGLIYKKFGILSSGHLIVANRASLVGEYIGHTERKVREALAAAEGGILFIDEIYALTENSGSCSTDNKDYGHRVVDALMPVLSDTQANIMVIGAGYPAQMKHFVDANPGLASRFSQTVNFADFSLDQLMQIASNHIGKFDFFLTMEAESKLRRLFEEARKIKNFGNARFVVTVIENHILPALCQRIDRTLDESCALDDLSIITSADIPELKTVTSLQLSDRLRVGFDSGAAKA